MRKQNGNLPGQGGVFNLVNLHVYHYAGNNPVKYTDPDGEDIVEGIKDAAGSVGQFISENKEALLTIALGGVQIVAGNLLKGGGVGGCLLLAGASGGALTAPEVAVGVAGISAGEALEVSGAVTMGIGFAMLASNQNGGDSHREKTRGANTNDKQQIDSVARDAKVDRREFGDFIENTKKAEGRGPSDNYTYNELQYLAAQFKELQ